MKKLIGLMLFVGVTGAMANDLTRAESLDSHNSFNFRPRQVACQAQNRRGQIFQAIGKNAHRVQQRAIQQCYQAGSRQCFAIGCRIF